jgi:hypothetical protein
MRWQFFTPLPAILFMASVLGCEPPQPADHPIPPVNPTPPAEQSDTDGAATEENDLNNNAENDLGNDNLPSPSGADDQIGG